MNNSIIIERKKLINLLNNIALNSDNIFICNNGKNLVFSNEQGINYMEYTLPTNIEQNINCSFYNKDVLGILTKLSTNDVEMKFFDKYILINDHITIKFKTETHIQKTQIENSRVYLPSALLLKLLNPLLKLIKQTKTTENDILKLESKNGNLIINLVNKFTFIELTANYESYDNYIFYLYRSTIVLLCNILNETDNSNLIEIILDTEKQIAICFDGYKIITQRSHLTTPSKTSLENKFINSICLDIEIKQLNNILNKICFVSKNHDFKYYTKIFIQDNKLCFLAKNSTMEVIENIINDEYRDKKIELALNSQTLKDCISCCENNKISLYFISKGQPIKLSTNEITIYLGTFSEVIF